VSGTLYGVGVGPGDPELLTLKAVRVLRAAPVIAYPAPLQGEGLARRIVADHLPGGQTEIVLRMAFDHAQPPPDDAYDRGAAEIAGHLAAGRDVAMLCEGDPLFFGSFAYVLERLQGRAPVQVIPGIASPMACSAVLARPLTRRDEMLAVVPATRSEAELAAALAACDAAVVMKLGRHLAKVRRVLERMDLAAAARVVAWAGHPQQRVMTLDEAEGDGVPYFSMVVTRRESR
jgi:precorrin-2/cobalt-factor-2 C20-methyltransferase